jgi:hypothetical protein
VRVDAQRRIYALDTTGLQNIDEWLKDVRDSGAAGSTSSSASAQRRRQAAEERNGRAGGNDERIRESSTQARCVSALAAG